METFQGYHAEWNLGCPGGWEYQRMAQERGKLCWRRVKEVSGIGIELSFDHPLLNPVPSFAEMLFRAHRAGFRGEKPFVLLVAEKETLDKVTENINLVQFLNRMEGVDAALTCPEEVEKTGADVTYKGKKVTVIFLDINNDTNEYHLRADTLFNNQTILTNLFVDSLFFIYIKINAKNQDFTCSM